MDAQHQHRGSAGRLSAERIRPTPKAIDKSIIERFMALGI